MTLDVRSLGEWLKDVFGRGRLSGGGPLGTPNPAADEVASGHGHAVDPPGSGGIGDPLDQPGRHKAN